MRRKNPVRTFTDVEAAWLAGVIDGEGSIGLYHFKGDGRRVVIQMGNTNERFVREMRRIIGAGSRIRRYKFHSSHKGRKPMFCYCLKGSLRCYRVLRQIEPFLIIKKKKASQIMREVEKIPFGRWGQHAL